VSYVLLEEAKAHLNKTGPNDNDELQGVIDAAEALIIDLIGPVLPVTVVDDRPGGRPTVWLSTPPALVITTVTAYAGGIATAVPAADITTGADGWRLDETRSALEHTLGAFPHGTIRVTYDAGRASVPAHVRLATLDLVAHLWNNSQTGKSRRPDPGVPGGVQRPDPWAMPAGVRNKLLGELLTPALG
jgi:hypothetical protein